MSQLIIANVAATYVLSQTGNILIFVSIIPVEMLFIFLCLKSLEIAISFSRLLIAVLVANIATSIVGIPLLFNAADMFLIAGTIILPISFLLSFGIESVIYGIVLKNKKIPKCKIVQFSCLSNLASYIIFFLALIFTYFGDYYNNGESLFLTPNPGVISREVRWDIHNYISFQRNFYSDKNRLASNWEELKFPNSKKSRSGFYQYDFQGDATKANFTATSKRKDFTSYRATIFVIKNKDNDKFIQSICETDKPSMTAPEIPQLVDGKFPCPPGSSDKSDEFRLRDR